MNIYSAFKFKFNFNKVDYSKNAKAQSFKKFTSPINFKGTQALAIESDSFNYSDEKCENSTASAYLDNSINSAQNLTKQEKLAIIYSFDKKVEEQNELCKQYRDSTKRGVLYATETEIKRKRKRLLDAEKRRTELLHERERLAGKINPNVAFIEDDKISPKEKKKIIDNSDNLVLLIDNKKYAKDATYKEAFSNRDYFFLNKTSYGNIIDTSFIEENELNYKTLMAEDLVSLTELKENYNISLKETKLYEEAEILTPVLLKNIKTGGLEPVQIYRKSSVDELIKRQKILKEKKISPSYFKGSSHAPINYLASIGFGSEKQLQEAIKAGELKGRYDEIDFGDMKQKVFNVDIVTSSAKSKLMELRVENKRFCNAAELMQMTGISLIDIEDAILSEKLETVQDYLFDCDKGVYYFNLANVKNANFVEMRQFEKQILKQFKNKNFSLKTEIILKLCPKIRVFIEDFLNGNPLYCELFDKWNSIEDFKELENKKPVQRRKVPPFKITRNENNRIRSLFDYFWQNRDLKEEYSKALSRTKIALKEAKKSGIQNISDSEIRDILVDLKNNDK